MEDTRADRADVTAGRARRSDAVARRLGGLSRRLRTVPIQLLVVAASPQELARALLNPNIRRGFPAYRARIARLAIVDLAILAAVAVLIPRLLLPLLGLVLVASGLYRWRARPNRGREQGWPPGSIAIGTGALADPDFFFKQLNKHGRVFKTNNFHDPMVCIVGLKEAGELFHNHAADLVPIPLSWDRFIPKGMARWMDGDIHDEYRSLLKTSFGARLLADNQAAIAGEIERALQRMAAACQESGSVHPLPYLEDMAFGAWAEMFFGISRGSERFARLRDGFDIIAVHDPGPISDVHAALSDIEHVLASAITESSEKAGTEPRTVLTGLLRRQTDATANPTTMMNLIYLMETSYHDVAGLLTWMLKHIGDHPQYPAALRAEDPTHQTVQSLANRMVSETVRLEQSEHLYRRTKADIPVGEFVIPTGWLVRVCVHESHRDPDLFPDPDRYNPDRFLEDRRPESYAPFGIDDHACIGETLTRTVARALITSLATGYDLETVSDGPRELSVQRQWAPSSHLRLQLTHRPESP